MSRQICISDICHSSTHVNLPNPSSRSAFYTALFPIYQKLHQSSEITVNEIVTEYKNVLNAYLLTLNQYYHVPELKHEYTAFSEHLKIWELCDALYFNTDSANLCKILMDWYIRHNKVKYVTFEMQSIYNNREGPLKHKNFWKYALRLTVFGRLDQLSHLLKSASTNSRLKYFTDLVNNLQMNLTNTAQLEQILVALKSPDFKHPEIYKDSIHLVKIVSILLGDEEAILEHALDRTHAFILYHYYQPSSLLDSQQIFTEATSFFTKYQRSNPDVCELLLTDNVYQAFTICAELDWWLLAHLTDLFTIQGKLDRPIEVTAGNSIVTLPAREYFILFYASFIKNQYDLWHIAFEYMLTCDDFGHEVMVEHLETMDLNKDDEELDKIVKYCMDHNLEKLGYYIYETKAHECITSNDYERAIELLKKGKLQHEIDNVFRVIIEDFAITGTMYDMNLLQDHHGLYFTIYHHFWKMHTGYRKKDVLLAVSAFNELVSNVNIPSSIIVIILWEGLKLIEDNNMLYFKKSDILKIQTIWKRLNENRSMDDFMLFHYHINKDDTGAEIPREALHNDMMVFLDTTGVLFARALDAAK